MYEYPGVQFVWQSSYRAYRNVTCGWWVPRMKRESNALTMTQPREFSKMEDDTQ